jgi:hypothetical protein
MLVRLAYNMPVLPSNQESRESSRFAASVIAEKKARWQRAVSR